MQSVIVSLMMLTTVGATTVFGGKFEDLTEYFSMKAGSVWTYQMGKGVDAVPSYQVKVTQCTDREEIAGCIFKTSIDPSLPPRHDVYAIQGDALLNKGTLAPFGPQEWQLHVPPQIELRSPLKVGTTWDRYDSDLEKTRCTIIEKGKVTVKGGSFDNVIQIQLVTFVRDTSKGKWKKYDRDSALIFRHYAPNVGLIKEEISKKRFVYIELVEYKAGE